MEIDPFYLFLLVKMAVTGLIVAGAATAAERYGPLLGAMIATLPVSVGPTYVFLALEHGAAFVGEAALGTLSVNSATAFFITVYAFAARRFSVAGALLIALGGYTLLTLGIIWLKPGFALACVMNLVAYPSAIWLTRGLVAVPPVKPPPRRWWDIPLRMLLAATIVAVVLLSAQRLGSLVSGVLASAPVALTSIVLILHPRLGGEQAAAVLVRSLPGLIGFMMAILVVYLGAATLGAPLVLLASLATSVAWNSMLLLKGRVAQPQPA